MIDLIAIRARDADYNDVFEAQANMSKDIAHRLVAWPVADRRDLLAYVDEQQTEIERLRSELAALRVDAERYRWLRCNSDAVGKLADYATDEPDESVWANGMDEFIDAALERTP